MVSFEVRQLKTTPLYNGILWLNAATEEELRTSFLLLTQQLGLSFDENLETTSNKVYQRLAHLPKVLIIFDGVIGFKQIKPYLPTQTYWTKTCHCIVITRYKKWPTIFYNLSLTEFTEEMALNYLQQALPQNFLVSNQLRELVHSLNYLPLALAQAVNYLLDNPDLTIKDYLERYKSMGEPEAEEEEKNSPEESNNAVTKTNYLKPKDLQKPQSNKNYRLKIEQDLLSSYPPILQAFRRCLIAVYQQSKQYETVGKIFICYAWPTDYNPKDFDKVRNFLTNLYKHLKLAGLGQTQLTINITPPKVNIYQYMDPAATADFILMIGNHGLFEEYQKNPSYKVSRVCDELERIIKERKSKQEIFHLIPLEISGGLNKTTIFNNKNPEISNSLANNASYFTHLQWLINFLYGAPISVDYFKNCWETFFGEIHDPDIKAAIEKGFIPQTFETYLADKSNHEPSTIEPLNTNLIDSMPREVQEIIKFLSNPDNNLTSEETADYQIKCLNSIVHELTVLSPKLSLIINEEQMNKAMIYENLINKFKNVLNQIKNINIFYLKEREQLTLLRTMIENGFIELMDALSKRKIDMIKIADENFLPLHTAANYQEDEIAAGMVKVLLTNISLTNQALKRTDEKAMTALHHAAKVGNKKTVAQLLEKIHGLNKDEQQTILNIQDIDGRTSLHWSCIAENNNSYQYASLPQYRKFSYYQDITQQLVKTEIEKYLPDYFGKTAKDYADELEYEKNLLKENDENKNIRVNSFTSLKQQAEARIEIDFTQLLNRFALLEKKIEPKLNISLCECLKDYQQSIENYNKDVQDPYSKTQALWNELNKLLKQIIYDKKRFAQLNIGKNLLEEIKANLAKEVIDVIKVTMAKYPKFKRIVSNQKSMKIKVTELTLHQAALSKDDEIAASLIHSLLNTHYPSLETFQKTNDAGMTVFHCAAKAGNLRAMEQLLKFINKVATFETLETILNMQDQQGRTALHWVHIAKRNNEFKYDGLPQYREYNYYQRIGMRLLENGIDPLIKDTSNKIAKDYSDEIVRAHSSFNFFTSTTQQRTMDLKEQALSMTKR